jgi:hypothetical protein
MRHCAPRSISGQQISNSIISSSDVLTSLQETTDSDNDFDIATRVGRGRRRHRYDNRLSRSK